MTTSIRLVAEDGTTTVVWLRPAVPSIADGIICQSHELPLAAPRVVDQPRAGQSGTDDLTEFHDATTFKTTLYVQDNATYTRHEWADILRGLCAPGRRPYLFIQRDGWLAERRAQLRADPLSYVVDQQAWRRLEVSLQFQVPDGVLEDTTLSTAVIRPLAVSTGMSFAMSFALSWAASSVGSATVLTSAGNVSTPWVGRMYGAFTDPVITNLTTGQTFTLTGVTVAAGSYLEIDVAARTVRLNGDPSLSYYNKVDFTVSEWWEMQAGANSISVATGSQDTACELDITWRDRYM